MARPTSKRAAPKAIAGNDPAPHARATSRTAAPKAIGGNDPSPHTRATSKTAASKAIAAADPAPHARATSRTAASKAIAGDDPAPHARASSKTAAPMAVAAADPSPHARATSRTAAPKAIAGDDPSPHGLWFCNWKIWLEARRRLDCALEPLGLRWREFWLLVIAGAGNTSQHEMADLCGLDPSSLVAVLDGMERRGLMHRQRNPDDRRVQWVKRTAEGDRLFARALPLAQRAEGQQLEALSAADRRKLVAAMQKLIATSKLRDTP